MGFVATGITEAGLVVADDRVEPIAEIERAVRTEFHVHWPETAARRFDQGRPVFESETCAIVDDVEHPHCIVDIAAHDERALPVIREVRRADDVAAAHFPAVAVFPDQRGRIVAVVHHQAGNGIDGRAVIARQHERFAQVGEDKAPRILRFMFGAVEAFELEPARP